MGGGSYRSVKMGVLVDNSVIIDMGGANMISADRYEELSELKRLNAKSYNVFLTVKSVKKGRR